MQARQVEKMGCVVVRTSPNASSNTASLGCALEYFIASASASGSLPSASVDRTRPAMAALEAGSTVSASL
jgi:hypothetical protein